MGKFREILASIRKKVCWRPRFFALKKTKKTNKHFECLKDSQGPQRVRYVKLICQSFIVELAEQIRMRFSEVRIR